MTAIDDLKRGDVVTVTAYRGRLAWDEREPEFDGIPLEIVGIGLPFLVLYDGRNNLTLDIRLWGVQRMPKEYAKAFHKDKLDLEHSDRRRKLTRVPGSRSTTRKRRKGACPRCHSDEVVKLYRNGIWKKVCKDCDWEKILRDDNPGSTVEE